MPSTAASHALTALVCCAYMAIGPAIILTNKWLIAYGGMPFPVVLTCLGQVATYATTTVLVHVLGVVPLPEVSCNFWSRNVLTVT